MDKHTPGPWASVGEYVEAIDLDTPLSICTIASCGTETNANSRLISAAPDLLAALEAVIDDLHEGIQDAVDNGASEFWVANARKRLLNARAAIRKARGD